MECKGLKTSCNQLYICICFLGLGVRENPDRTRLTSSSLADPLQFASLFCLFSEALLFARNSPFYFCPLLFSFLFLSPYSAYFGVLCNFLGRFFGLPLRCLLVAFFGRSVSLYPAYFQLKPRTWIITISSGWQSFNSAGIVLLRVI